GRVRNRARMPAGGSELLSWLDAHSHRPRQPAAPGKGEPPERRLAEECCDRLRSTHAAQDGPEPAFRSRRRRWSCGSAFAIRASRRSHEDAPYPEPAPRSLDPAARVAALADQPARGLTLRRWILAGSAYLCRIPDRSARNAISPAQQSRGHWLLNAAQSACQDEP